MIEVNGEKVRVREDRMGWSTHYGIWEITLLTPTIEDGNFGLTVITDQMDHDLLDDSGVPLDADRDEVEDFMQEAWDTFLTTYLAEIERSHQIRNPRIVCEDGAWAVVGDD